MYQAPSAGGAGGAISVIRSSTSTLTITIAHYIFTNNQAGELGGAIAAGGKAPVQLLDVTFSGNQPIAFSKFSMQCLELASTAACHKRQEPTASSTKNVAFGGWLVVPGYPKLPGY